MRFLATIILGFASSIIPLGANPEFAMVRVRDIFSTLPSTVQMEKKMKEDIEAIMKDKRAVKLREVVTDFQRLEASLNDEKKPLEKDEKEKTVRLFEAKKQETETLQEDFKKFKAQREMEINQNMVKAMRQTLSEIVEHSQKIAAKHGYRVLLDPTGNTNSTVPFVVYQKNSPDITEEVVAAMKNTTKQP